MINTCLLLVSIFSADIEPCSQPIYPNIEFTRARITPDYYKMAGKDFLFDLRTEIVAVGTDGVERWRLKHDPGFKTVSFAHFESAQGILVQVSDRNITKTFLYRPEVGDTLFSASEKTKKSATVPIHYPNRENGWEIHEFIPVGSRLFLNVLINPDEGFLLQEVEMLNKGDSFELKAKGDGFNELHSAYSGWSEDFRRRWVAETEQGELITIHQLQDRFWRFASQAKQREDNDDGKTLKLPHYEQPYRPSKKQLERIGWKEWATSFSHITGLYRIGEDLLVSYIAPSLDEDNSDVYDFVLHLQPIDTTGKPIEESRVIPGGILMGVDSEQETAYVFRWEEEVPVICNIEF